MLRRRGEQFGIWPALHHGLENTVERRGRADEKPAPIVSASQAFNLHDRHDPARKLGHERRKETGGKMTRRCRGAGIRARLRPVGGIDGEDGVPELLDRYRSPALFLKELGHHRAVKRRVELRGICDVRPCMQPRLERLVDLGA